MRSVFVLAVLFTVTALASGYATFDLQQDIMDYEWNEFKDKFNKKYENDAEHNLRQKYYLENRYLITKHNAKFTSGKTTNAERPSFKLGLNEYGKFTNFNLVVSFY